MIRPALSTLTTLLLLYLVADVAVITDAIILIAAVAVVIDFEAGLSQ